MLKTREYVFCGLRVEIWIISLLSNLRPGYLKTQSPQLFQNAFLVPELIVTRWVSRNFVQATFHYMEQDKHLKTPLPL